MVQNGEASQESTGEDSLGHLVVHHLKSALFWMGRFFGTVTFGGIVIQALEFLRMAIPPLSYAILAVECIFAVVMCVYIGSLFPSWLPRLPRTKISSRDGEGWLRSYAFYRIFR